MRTKPALIATATLASIAVVAIAVTRPAHHRAATAMAAPHGVLGVAYAAEAAAAGVSTRTVAGLGPVLVNASGSRTLYVFLPDARAQVECVAICTTFWAPLKLAPGQTSALTGRGAKRSLIGSVPGAGGRVVTYAGWPLYTYTNDDRAGLANGQGALLPEPCAFLQLDCSLNLAGPVSYVLAPSGAIVKKHPSPTALGQ